VRVDPIIETEAIGKAAANVDESSEETWR